MKTVVTVTGPSASGKTELVSHLCAEYGYQKLVSITTRPPRVGEVEGIDYYFVTEEDFLAARASGKLVQEVNFNGKFYATTSDEISRVFSSGKIPIVIVEPGGVDQFKNAGEKLEFVVTPVFVHAPFEVLKARFLARLTGSEPTSYDLQRLAAIATESRDWISARDWDMVVGNHENDITQITKLAMWVAENIEEKIALSRIKE